MVWGITLLPCAALYFDRRQKFNDVFRMMCVCTCDASDEHLKYKISLNRILDSKIPLCLCTRGSLVHLYVVDVICHGPDIFPTLDVTKFLY